MNHNKLTMIDIYNLFGCVLQRVYILHVHYRWNVTYFDYAANSVTERYSQGEHYLFIVPVLKPLTFFSITYRVSLQLLLYILRMLFYFLSNKSY